MNQPENNPKKRKDLKDLIDAIEDKTYSSNNNPKNQDSVNRGQDDPDLDFEASIQETQNNLDDSQTSAENKLLKNQESNEDSRNREPKNSDLNIHSDQIISKSERFVQMVEVLRKYHAFKGMTPVKLRMILEDLGPTYVKLGQIMSSRSDILDPVYCKELEKLRSNAEPMDEETVREIIKQTYGKEPEELFLEFDMKAIGAASMAQVHKAKTKDGSDVVVKIQRPNIYAQMEVDVDILKKASGLVDLNKTISSIVNLNDVLDEFWNTAKQEMDFRHEAMNAEKFASNYKGIRFIMCPKIYDEFTRKHVLVMQNIEGVQIDDYEALNQLGYSREEIAMKLADNYIDQVADKGYFHADPHSGNIRIWDGKICWLDFGMMGSITPGEASLINQALNAIVSGDHVRLTDAVLAIGIHTREVDYVAFSNQLEDFMQRYLSSSLDDIDVTQVVNDMIKICHTNGIMLPRNITMLLRSLVTIEGTMKDLDPEVNILTIVKKRSQVITGEQVEKQFRDLLVRWSRSANQAADIPMEVADLLRMIRKGQFRMNLKLTDADTMMPDVNKMVDRIVVCVLIAALLMGSSVICTTNLKPTFLDIPLLGFAGFFLSFCLSVWLFIKMLFRGRKNSIF
ncbi:ABC1 kinase family protein [Ileibacterium valens]|uniref:ABC1 kinase family protein n=1 Tax=Ileibacterium valens TaxID=1862668 RepID=UPI0024B88892|nr:AarF/UbiB family protein [Ileibacterium valens]